MFLTFQKVNSTMQLKNSNMKLQKGMKEMKRQVAIEEIKNDNRQKTQALERLEMKEEIKALKQQMAMLLTAGSVPDAKAASKKNTKNWKSAKNKLKSVAAFKQRRRSSLMTSSVELDLV